MKSLSQLESHGHFSRKYPFSVFLYAFTPVRTVLTQNVLNIGDKLSSCYGVLGLSAECSKIELKDRYLALVKQHHPDSGGTNADAEKFNTIQEAYKFIIDNDYSESDRQELQSQFDIRHTAPQHRQYLEFEGVGAGTPAQRQRQYGQYRVRRATENVREHRVNRLIAEDMQGKGLVNMQNELQKEAARRAKTTSAIERLVEDLILEAMNKGEFDKLKGVGKPLTYSEHNPYLDTITTKLNRILIQNGFCPEWVTLEKEIRSDIRDFRKRLVSSRGSLPLNSGNWTTEQISAWEKASEGLNNEIACINKQIDRFNLLVPILSRQFVQLKFEREIKKSLKTIEERGLPEEQTDKLDTVQNSQQKKNARKAEPGFLDSLFKLFI